MKQGTRMQPVDSAGLPNSSPGAHRRTRVCPVCSEPRPEGATSGAGWKWLAAHLAEHLGYEWTERGWVWTNPAWFGEATNSGQLASERSNSTSSTTTHDDE